MPAEAEALAIGREALTVGRCRRIAVVDQSDSSADTYWMHTHADEYCIANIESYVLVASAYRRSLSRKCNGTAVELHLHISQGVDVVVWFGVGGQNGTS